MFLLFHFFKVNTFAFWMPKFFILMHGTDVALASAAVLERYIFAGEIVVKIGLKELAIGAVFGAGIVTAIRKSGRRYDLRDKTVLITGGSRGLGLVMTRAFAREGARIAICARDGDEVERAREELEGRGTQVFGAVCDVTDADGVNRLIDDVKTRFGRIDVLVNNAGVIQVGPLETQTKKDFEEALASHFWGPFNTMQAVLPEMRRGRGGRIVNIASIGAKVAVPHLLPYCASKFALAGLSSGMRAELLKDNIYVTTVYPGLMRTGSHIKAKFKGQNKKEFALFSLSNATPVSSISAERAAAQIVEATRRGDAELVISFQAKLAVKMNALFPEFTSDIMGLISQLLPEAGGIGKQIVKGSESTSAISPSFITSAIDHASAENNELKTSEQSS
jgi:NAD(P)-dependent dehydrogenase (short-subunit alcohol dehydrogenase family)